MQPTPDTIDIWRGRYTEACRAFHAGEQSIDVFRANLYSLGYRGSEIECEVNLNWPTPATNDIDFSVPSRNT